MVIQPSYLMKELFSFIVNFIISIKFSICVFLSFYFFIVLLEASTFCLLLNLVTDIYNVFLRFFFGDFFVSDSMFADDSVFLIWFGFFGVMSIRIWITKSRRCSARYSISKLTCILLINFIQFIEIFSIVNLVPQPIISLLISYSLFRNIICHKFIFMITFLVFTNGFHFL